MLIDDLKEYGEAGNYPFHMPGHKRQISLGITSFPNPFSVDITEIEGFDNLHHAEGLLKESMDRAARIYGTDRTWYLVNGSTGGILSAVCGLTKPGDRILMGRNSHKSAYHAVLLNRLEPVYLYPEQLTEAQISGDPGQVPGSCAGIPGGLLPEKVEKLLEENPGIRAVFLTSPTYEGVVSDVAGIAKAAHRYKIPLIVDEAHGAHFPFGEDFPESAVDCGADVVIQSLHKTLPSLTQTAVIHLKSSLVRAEQLERYLPVFQSSSPSYVFLAAMESCISYMDGEGRHRMSEYGRRLQTWMEEVRGLRHLRVVGDEICGKAGVRARDLSKLVVLAPDGGQARGWDGTGLAKRLREQFGLEPEMACSHYVILMTSLMDTEEGFVRLQKALKALDAAYDSERNAAYGSELDAAYGSELDAAYNRAPGMKGCPAGDKAAAGSRGTAVWLENPVQGMALSEAWNGEKEGIPLELAKGRIAGGFVTVYPPGVPMLVPGEVITAEAIRLIRENRGLGLTVEGIAGEGEYFIPAVRTANGAAGLMTSKQ